MYFSENISSSCQILKVLAVVTLSDIPNTSLTKAVNFYICDLEGTEDESISLLLCWDFLLVWMSLVLSTATVSHNNSSCYLFS